jgi:hypothetical protein
MKQKTFKQRCIRISIVIATTFLLLPVFILFSFKSKFESFSDIWKQLGITESNASGNIRESFLSGYLQYGTARNIKNIAIGDRKEVTTDLLNYTKTYLQSAEFKKAYEAQRQGMKPREVTRKARTEEQIRQEMIDNAKQGMTNAQTSIKTATGDMKKVFEDLYQMFKAQLEDYQRPDNEMVPMMAQGEKMGYENDLKNYAESIKKWEISYPSEPSKFVKVRLQEVLKATADIDYNAQLVQKGNKKYFAKKEYESKNPNWKMGYRAGREVTETMRTFVQKWILEL